MESQILYDSFESWFNVLISLEESSKVPTYYSGIWKDLFMEGLSPELAILKYLEG